jgi:hypothetical protein
LPPGQELLCIENTSSRSPYFETELPAIAALPAKPNGVLGDGPDPTEYAKAIIEAGGIT